MNRTISFHSETSMRIRSRLTREPRISVARVRDIFFTRPLVKFLPIPDAGQIPTYLRNFLPIPEAESLPFYPSVLKLVECGHRLRFQNGVMARCWLGDSGGGESAVGLFSMVRRRTAPRQGASGGTDCGCRGPVTGSDGVDGGGGFHVS